MKDNFAHAAFRCAGAIVALMAVLASPATAEQLRLLMFEENGCYWCARWNEEIGPAYPNTEQGKAAPLERHDIHSAVPDGLELERPAHLSPTFVLVEGNTEVGRIEGYPGPDFFWFLLDEIIARADPADS